MPISTRSTVVLPEESEAPPVNDQLERELLGYVLIKGTIHPKLTRDSFKLQDHKKIFDCIDNMIAAGKAVDYITVNAALGNIPLGDSDGIGYLTKLSENGLPSKDVTPYVEILNELARRRTVINVGDLMAQAGRLGVRELDNIINDSVAMLQDLLAPGSGEIAPTLAQWPDPLGPAAFHGLAGEFVELLRPHTESDDAALLLQFLTGWGSMTGRGPYYLAEADRHHTNLYAVMLGSTSKGRKGTSWSRVLGLLRTLDEDWAKSCLLYGLGSGEALLESVSKDDKRRLVVESELARLLAIIAREGATISSTFRQCWDSGNADITVRGKEVHAENAHLSMIGHITRDELLKRLTQVEIGNGFGNRILWACVRRSKMLPFGGGAVNFGDLPERLKEATFHTRRMGNTRVDFDHDARELWRDIYPQLSEGKSGLAGAIVSRAEAQTVRLSLIYALLDCSDQIRVEHLRAALEVWRYCEDSALYIWGDAMGDETADKILKAIRENREGLTRWDINNHFSGHKKVPEIDRAINLLVERGVVRAIKEETGGRPSVRYTAA